MARNAVPRVCGSVPDPFPAFVQTSNCIPLDGGGSPPRPGPSVAGMRVTCWCAGAARGRHGGADALFPIGHLGRVFRKRNVDVGGSVSQNARGKKKRQSRQVFGLLHKSLQLPLLVLGSAPAKPTLSVSTGSVAPARSASPVSFHMRWRRRRPVRVKIVNTSHAAWDGIFRIKATFVLGFIYKSVVALAFQMLSFLVLCGVM